MNCFVSGKIHSLEQSSKWKSRRVWRLGETSTEGGKTKVSLEMLGNFYLEIFTKKISNHIFFILFLPFVNKHKISSKHRFIFLRRPNHGEVQTILHDYEHFLVFSKARKSREKVKVEQLIKAIISKQIIIWLTERKMEKMGNNNFINFSLWRTQHENH